MRGILLWGSVLGQGHAPLQTSSHTHTHTHTRYGNTHFDLVKQSKSTFFARFQKISLHLPHILHSFPHRPAMRAEQQKCPQEDVFTLEADFTSSCQEFIIYLHTDLPTVWRTHGQYHKSEISKHILGWQETTWKTITTTVVGQLLNVVKMAQILKCYHGAKVVWWR